MLIGKCCQLYLAIALTFASFTPAFGQTKTTDQAIDETQGDGAHSKFKAVFDAMQAGVENNDAAVVASLVDYPIALTIEGKNVIVKHPKDFVARYNAIFTSDISATITTQKYDDLMVNSDGVAFGNGQIWLVGICEDNACKNFDVKVKTIQKGPQ